jgi:CheY-like chemotaxis protein
MVVKKKLLNLETMSILAVDDMKSMRLTIRKMLRSLNIGKDLKFAENGREGLTILRSVPIDLVIVDWRMPVLNGSQMLESIRNDKLLRDIPVIMVTAESERDIVLEVAETEIDAYLLKPLTLDALDRKIRGVVERTNNPDQGTILIHQARQLEEAGEPEAAIERLKRALKYKPTASRPLRNLGLLYLEIGQQEIAEKYLRKAALVNSQDAITRQILGDMYIKKNELKKAADYYLEALSLSTKFSEQGINLGKKLLQAGIKQPGIQIFSKIIAGSKKNMPEKQQIVDLCLEYEEYEYAKKLLESIIKESPKKYDMVFQTAEVYYITEDYTKALKLFENVHRNQSSRIDVKLKIAQIYCDINKPLKADEYINMVLQKEPENEKALELRRST